MVDIQTLLIGIENEVVRDGEVLFIFFVIDLVIFSGLPQNPWVKKLGLCPRPQDFQGMARVSNGAAEEEPLAGRTRQGLMHRWRTVGLSIPCRVASPQSPTPFPQPVGV